MKDLIINTPQTRAFALIRLILTATALVSLVAFVIRALVYPSDKLQMFGLTIQLNPSMSVQQTFTLITFLLIIAAVGLWVTFRWARSIAALSLLLIIIQYLLWWLSSYQISQALEKQGYGNLPHVLFLVSGNWGDIWTIGVVVIAFAFLLHSAWLQRVNEPSGTLLYFLRGLSLIVVLLQLWSLRVALRAGYVDSHTRIMEINRSNLGVRYMTIITIALLLGAMFVFLRGTWRLPSSLVSFGFGLLVYGMFFLLAWRSYPPPDMPEHTGSFFNYLVMGGWSWSMAAVPILLLSIITIETAMIFKTARSGHSGDADELH